MLPMNKIFTIILLSMTFAISNAQNTFNTIRGRVVDSLQINNIPWSYIWNESTHKGSFADAEGSFIINGNLGDTLVFSSMGYQACVIKGIAQTENLIIPLKTKVYALEAVQIRRFKNYESFRREFLAHQEPEIKSLAGLPTYRETLAPGQEYDALRTNPLAMVFSPISAIYANFSATEKSKLKVRQLKAEKNEYSGFNNWHTRENLAHYTGLSGEKLDKFILYCKINPKQLNNYDEYSYYTFIREKLAEFLQADSIENEKKADTIAVPQS